MKVFTSVFVLDGLQTTFDDIEQSLRSDPEFSGETDEMRHRIVELQALIGRMPASDGPELAEA